MAQGGGKVRVKPPAFKRDSVDLGRHGRNWQTIEACELEPGDMIMGRGMVHAVHFENGQLRIELLMRDVITYALDAKVEAFSKKQILTTDSH